MDIAVVSSLGQYKFARVFGSRGSFECDLGKLVFYRVFGAAIRVGVLLTCRDY